MKRYFLIALLLAPFFAGAQSGTGIFSAIRSKVADSTTVATPVGYGIIYYNAQSNKFRVYANGVWSDLGAGGSFTLTNGNGTTASGTAVNLGGTSTANINFQIGSGFQYDIATNPANTAAGSLNVYDGGATNRRVTLNGKVSSESFVFSLGTSATYGDGAKFYDARTTKTGIEYSADYSAGFTTRSLVDKAYADAAAAVGNWRLGTSGTFTAALTFTGSTTNTLKYVFNSIGSTKVNGAGAYLQNTTVASAGSQQDSPLITLEGNGWKTNATAASQAVAAQIYVRPVQAAANPTGILFFDHSINAGSSTGTRAGIVMNPSASALGGFALYDAGGTERGFLQLNPASEVKIGSNSGYYTTFYGGGTEGARITSTGNTLFGTTVSTATTTKVRIRGENSSTATALLVEDTGGNAMITAATTSGAGTGVVTIPTLTNTTQTTTQITTNGDSHTREITRGVTSITAATTATREVVDVSEIANGDAVTIEISYAGKDDSSNTGFGGTFIAVWTKSGGAIQLVGETGGTPSINDTGGSFTISTADNSGSIDLTITESGVSGNFSCSIIAKITFFKA